MLSKGNKIKVGKQMGEEDMCHTGVLAWWSRTGRVTGLHTRGLNTRAGRFRVKYKTLFSGRQMVVFADVCVQL